MNWESLSRRPPMKIPYLRWWIAGLLYGLALWIVMYWIVMPLRE